MYKHTTKSVFSKIVIFTLIAAMALFAITGCDNQDPGKNSEPDPNGEDPNGEMEPTQLTLMTGVAGAGLYAIGTAISEVVNRHGPDYLDVTAVTSTGTAFNAVEVGTRGANVLGVNLCVIAASAYHKDPPMEWNAAYPNLRYVLPCNPGMLHWVTLEGSGIESFADFEGKRLGVTPGGFRELFLDPILDYYGMDYDSVEVILGTASELADYLKDGFIDAYPNVVAVPAAVISETAITHKIRLLELDDGAIDHLLELYPWYTIGTIPKGSYNGVDEDVKVIQWHYIITANAETDERVIYDFVKTCFDHKSELEEIYPGFTHMMLEHPYYENPPIPIHDGAKRFFEEQ